MDREQKTLRLGAWVILGALVLRLLGSSLPAITRFLTSREAVSFMVFLQTGRVLRPVPDPPQSLATAPTEPTAPAVTEPTEPATTGEAPQTLAVFSADDAQLVSVSSACGYDADILGGLQQSLTWDLKTDAPTVLIIHSHGTESYTPTGEYTESSPYRTKDPGYNVVSIGDRLVQVLESGGIHALHDRTLHDSPSYNEAYANARTSIQNYLSQYPSIRLVLDIHRDAVEDASGQQMVFSVTKDQDSLAQLMLVVGSDAAGLHHPDWSDNMSLAVKLHALLEKQTPGICRPINLRSQRFNQDLSPGALIVEVGSAGNSHREALAAAEELGKAILALAGGSKTLS